MRFNLSVVEALFAELAEPLGVQVAKLSEPDRARAAIDAVARLRVGAGLPQRLPIQVSEADLEPLSEWAAKSAGPNPRKTEPADAKELIKQVVTMFAVEQQANIARSH
jgi:alcohol dehydrogenase class IV